MVKETETPLISILMPVYNVEAYVGAAIESIQSQTYQYYELIVIDDCSTDGTLGVVESYAAADPRIRIYKNESNSKIVKSLNRGLKEVNGEFILRMDGDDISDPERISTLYRYLCEHEDCDLIGSYSLSIDENGNELAKHKLPISDKWITRTLRYCSTVQHIWLSRKAVYDKLKCYRDYPGAEDYDFLLRAKHFGFKFANYPDYLYQVRIREGNTESTEGLRRVLTKQYVYQLADRSSPDIDEASFDAFLSRSEKEKENYRRASNLLNRALHERSRPFAMLKDILHAAIASRHMFRYLYESAIVRISIVLERRQLQKEQQ